MKKKKDKFYEEMKDKSWLSWNYADWKAFQYVKKEYEISTPK